MSDTALFFMFTCEELLGDLVRDCTASAALGPVRQSCTALRQLLTNADPDTPPPIASMRSARDAVETSLADAGLMMEISGRLKRKKPDRYSLVHQILPGLWCGGWSALNNDW